ncbi:MAG: hypothetical protein NWF00_06090 [Candidatus Bathyarchaeota archaeon]|nr:hypothetical protein [Candidatus Bathyarchaeota archaeon]
MHRAISIYGRKIFSIFLIFNALLTISCAVGILSGFYAAYPYWQPFAPYILDGNLFWLLIVASIVNIFPAACVGKVHTGRLWFHHYVYGFFVMVLSAVWIILFTSVSLLSMFFINTTSISVNIGRFFMIGGLSLVLDDLPDVHKVTFRGLQWLKGKACQARRMLHAAQLVLGSVALYFVVGLSLFLVDNPQWITPANIILIETLVVTAITSFGSAMGKIWLNLQLGQKDSCAKH